MSNIPQFEEIQHVIHKLAAIPPEERDFHIDYLSRQMSEVEHERYATILREIFEMIDNAEKEFFLKQSN